MKQWIWWKNIWQRGCHAASTWPAKVEGSSLLHWGIQLPRDHFPVVLSFHCEKKVLLNYFPGIRDPVKKFLVSLRDWPVSEQYLIDYFMSIYLHQPPQQVQMGYSSVPHTLYKKKVEELLELHQPFARTPTTWEGCKGSSPQYRGYPCALW